MEFQVLMITDTMEGGIQIIPEKIHSNYTKRWYQNFGGKKLGSEFGLIKSEKK